MSGVVVELILTQLDRRIPGRALAGVIDLLPDPRRAEQWSDDTETCERILAWLEEEAEVKPPKVTESQIAEWRRIVADHTPISASDPCPTCGPVCEPTWRVQRQWAKDMLESEGGDIR